MPLLKGDKEEVTGENQQHWTEWEGTMEKASIKLDAADFGAYLNIQ